jgi:hypothetical protein
VLSFAPHARSGCHFGFWRQISTYPHRGTSTYGRIGIYSTTYSGAGRTYILQYRAYPVSKDLLQAIVKLTFSMLGHSSCWLLPVMPSTSCCVRTLLLLTYKNMRENGTRTEEGTQEMPALSLQREEGRHREGPCARYKCLLFGTAVVSSTVRRL